MNTENWMIFFQIFMKGNMKLKQCILKKNWKSLKKLKILKGWTFWKAEKIKEEIKTEEKFKCKKGGRVMEAAESSSKCF